MDKRLEEMLEHLAMACGGHSQYDMEMVGRCIAGQINNNGWSDPVNLLCGHAASIIAERWVDVDPPGAERNDFQAIFAACQERLLYLDSVQERTQKRY